MRSIPAFISRRFLCLLFGMCAAVSIARAETAPDPAVLGSWHVKVDGPKFADYVCKIEKELFVSNEGGHASAAAVRWKDGELSIKQWSIWRTFKIQKNEKGLQLQEGNKVFTLSKLDETPAELNLEPMQLGRRADLKADEIAEISRELLRREKTDQDYRNGKGKNADAENVAYVKKLLLDVGWIDRPRFGTEASRAAWLIVQHSLDLRIMRAVLGEIEKDVTAASGKRDDGKPIFGSMYALLYDRVMLNLGKPQRYGSQLGEDAAHNPLVPSLEDPANVNIRRAQMGFYETLFTYMSGFRAEFGGKAVRIDWDDITPGAPLPNEKINGNEHAELFKDNHWGGDFNVEALEKIKLPANATRDQIKAYIQKIIEVCREQHSFSSNDPQVGMLVEIGAENLDLLIERTEIASTYRIAALSALLKPEHKAAILKALPQSPDLMSIVIQQNWVIDAREVIVQKLEQQPEKTPWEWASALAGLNDKSDAELLKKAMLRNTSPRSVYEALAKRGDIDLNATVAELWKNRPAENNYRLVGIAEVAVNFGFVDALEIVASHCDDKWVGPNYRKLLVERLGLAESTDFKTWLKQNKADLVFDAATRKYQIKK